MVVALGARRRRRLLKTPLMIRHAAMRAIDVRCRPARLLRAVVPPPSRIGQVARLALSLRVGLHDSAVVVIFMRRPAVVIGVAAAALLYEIGCRRAAAEIGNAMAVGRGGADDLAVL